MSATEMNVSRGLGTAVWCFFWCILRGRHSRVLLAIVCKKFMREAGVVRKRINQGEDGGFYKFEDVESALLGLMANGSRAGHGWIIPVSIYKSKSHILRTI